MKRLWQLSSVIGALLGGLWLLRFSAARVEGEQTQSKSLDTYIDAQQRSSPSSRHAMTAKKVPIEEAVTSPRQLPLLSSSGQAAGQAPNERHKSVQDRATNDDQVEIKASEDSTGIPMASETWREDAEAFYRDELALDDEAIQDLKDLTDSVGDQIREIVSRCEASPDDTCQPVQIDLVTAPYLSKVKVIFGPRRYEQAAAFQKAFNERVRERFGADIRFVGFL